MLYFLNRVTIQCIMKFLRIPNELFFISPSCNLGLMFDRDIMVETEKKKWRLNRWMRAANNNGEFHKTHCYVWACSDKTKDKRSLEKKVKDRKSSACQSMPSFDHKVPPGAENTKALLLLQNTHTQPWRLKNCFYPVPPPATSTHSSLS